ncbi:TPA: hypothetical protein R2P05_000473 [Campylobacter jejuni]|nr:hypothetical protein [Campylobacter jejuni]EFN6206397.1 hypothetical protein [Campylobacter jejuni]HEC2934307.1 hypothetical protein [Campylobacter jejuni]HEC2939581.1 hypothetical protein [Campylobacter jejuni]HEC2941351.1 hypothetical protein [Campylobacter jejuni]
MLPTFKASFEVANYSPSDGSNNTFICFEFLTAKEQKLAIFNLFIAKNNDFSYEKYIEIGEDDVSRTAL